MKRTIIVLMIIGLFLVSGVIWVNAGEKAPQKLVDLTHSTLAKLGSDPVIVKAVKAENAKKKTLAQIKEINTKWENADENNDFVKALLKSECAMHLHKLKKSIDDVEEMYVLDNQGAVVASILFEEKYWWGELPRFKQVTKGEVFISDIEMDEDEMEYMVHVLVPVKDGDTVIGAIDIGLEVED